MTITISPKLAGLGVAALVAAFGAVAASASVSSAAPPASNTRHIQKIGTAAYKPVPVGSGAPASVSTEIPKVFGPEAQDSASAGVSNRSLAPAGSARANTARAHAQAAPNGIIRTGPQLLASFDGLNERDQRTANGGNQFSVEPPDQGMCVGGGHVVEVVNTVFRVFNADGTGQTGVVDLNTFYGYPAQIDRTGGTGAQGPFVTDPSCLYDPTTKTFFLAALTLEQTPAGAFTGDNHLDIAVAKDPTGTWNIYRLDVTDDGTFGTPIHPHCPCLGDYPHMGVDSNGFYLTTNEYSFFGTEYNSAQLYAFSKRALARGDANVLVTQFDTTAADRGLNGFTIWPAQSPTTGDYSRDQGGTEFFLSSNAAQEATGTNDYVSNSIVTWSLTNTRSLDTSSPNLALRDTRVGVTTYSLPPAANQKAGPFPLGQCLNDTACATFLLGAPDPGAPETEYPLDSNDTRMQQVTYTGGNLYGALDTAVTVGGATKAGVGWYIVRPAVNSHSVSANLLRQGQLGLAGNNLTYPAIGVTAAGKGVMTFTLVGAGYYPSAAYAAFDGTTGAGSMFLAKAGAGPADGFSGYKAFNNPIRPRWGDYGATAVDGNTIWIASEYIGQTCTLAQYETTPFGSCGATRTALANWDTRISLIKP
ncbi:MAG TPA: hypothetical protein VJT31_12250 [Rugosimonospora sp.]|nr:hypothetical protein [Rugosimonospora sp.]